MKEISLALMSIEKTDANSVEECKTLDELSAFLCKDLGKLNDELIEKKKEDIEKYMKHNGHKVVSINFNINTGLFRIEIE